MENYVKFFFSIFLGLQFTLFAQISQKESGEIKALSHGADIIITGKVVKQKSNWNKEKTRIYTEATLKADEYLKGNNNGQPLIVSYPGGEVGDVGELYTHMPIFSNNEEVLVFLKKSKNSPVFKVFNGEDGKIKIVTDAKTGEKVTSSNVRIDVLKAKIKNYLKEQ
jgi:hypothetical protein